MSNLAIPRVSPWPPHSGTELSGKGPAPYPIDSDLEKSSEAWIPQGKDMLGRPSGTLGQQIRQRILLVSTGPRRGDPARVGSSGGCIREGAGGEYEGSTPVSCASHGLEAGKQRGMEAGHPVG